MKNWLTVIFATVSLFSVSSCFKTGDKTSKPTDTTSLLTGQTWVYYEYFENFDSVNTSLVWKTNRSINALNLALNQVTFNPDFTYTEIDQNGRTLNGTWSYVNGDSGTRVVNSEGVFTSRIESITGNRYEWLDSTGRYGVMIPKGLVDDTTGGRMTLITAHPWVYSEYFYNFEDSVPSLVWKTNKENSSFNLHLNVVQYYPNGTYTETDQYGTVYQGTWSFTNNETGTTVTNSLGTFSSTIELLSTDRYEWYDGVSHYGEMVPQ